MAIEQGGTLPEVALTAPDGTPFQLRDFVGRPLVVYFYPKDDTPGCTREAQEFSAALADFQALHCTLLGISQDKPAKHQKFIAKYDLAVPLASDEDGSVLAAFGTWIEKQLYGKTYMGIDRSTFLFDAAGTLVRSWRKVRVPGHVGQVLDAVRAL
ncbi:peroxiredoxin [Sphingomonas sp. PB4P5]|uniref:peroxiredoxin n=1 Tax=Parasphingomonas puruogangriensis TaxID=3096155 RepID=UPI002FCC1989